jgi:hypothetical protein
MHIIVCLITNTTIEGNDSQLFSYTELQNTWTVPVNVERLTVTSNIDHDDLTTLLPSYKSI